MFSVLLGYMLASGATCQVEAGIAAEMNWGLDKVRLPIGFHRCLFKNMQKNLENEFIRIRLKHGPVNGKFKQVRNRIS